MDLTIDQYTPLSFKSGFKTHSMPSWVPPEHRRRLTAYMILAAYTRNASREFLTGESKNRREYGDAALLISRITGAVLGDSTTIAVEGAQRPPQLPHLPEEPELEGVDERIATRAREIWQQSVDDAIMDWIQAWEDYPAAMAQQDALVEWARAERLDNKLIEFNGTAAELGDGVAELSISTKRGRPLLTIHDPGFYFPVLDDHEFPHTVHIAWEIVEDSKRYVRRKTWRLVDGAPRTYPWSDEPTTTRCLFSDGKWELTGSLGDLDEAKAQWYANEDGVPVKDLDIGLDFIPVVHLPNTETSEHFGMSSISLVAQLLDDIQEADTDLRLSAGLAAVPIIAVSGSARLPANFQVEPGQTVSLGEGGRLDAVSMHSAVTELRSVVDDLLDRLSTNSQVSPEILGRTESSGARSGFAMLLSFGPFTQLINDLRLTRQDKHALLLKFACRMMQLTGQIEPGELARADIVPGPFLPSDLQSLVEQVVKLVAAGAISRATGVEMLTRAGVPIEDAEAEVARIRADDPDGARAAADATGSSEIGAEWLGVTLPEVIPEISLPPLQPE